MNKKGKKNMNSNDIYQQIEYINSQTEGKENHEVESWCVYIRHHLNRAEEILSTPVHRPNDRAIKEIWKTAALIIRCLEEHGARSSAKYIFYTPFTRETLEEKSTEISKGYQTKISKAVVSWQAAKNFMEDLKKDPEVQPKYRVIENLWETSGYELAKSPGQTYHKLLARYEEHLITKGTEVDFEFGSIGEIPVIFSQEAGYGTWFIKTLEVK